MAGRQLTAAQFAEGAGEIAQAAPWQLVERDRLGVSHLVLRASVRAGPEPGTAIMQVGDDEAAVTAAESDTRVYDVHVVYSSSYSVPALFLQVYGADGRPLDAAEVLPLVNERLRVGGDSEDGWTYLAQDMHPVLDMPFMRLHPCGTAQLMQHVLAEWDSATLLAEPLGPRDGRRVCRSYGAVYLQAWLRIVLPLVLPRGISLPLPLPIADTGRADV